MKTTVYVTRHGETEWNVEKRMQGRKNSALTENGMLQAKQLGDRMKDLPIDAIYSSPSERTLHTAELIKGERDVPISRMSISMKLTWVYGKDRQSMI